MFLVTVFTRPVNLLSDFLRKLVFINKRNCLIADRAMFL
jgi:hypothetical protein